MSEERLFKAVSMELGLRADQVARTALLLDDGNTVPFVARYRKEATGGLDEEQIRQVQLRVTYLRNLEERREVVLRSIAEQGQLTPELEAVILAAETLQAVEDLYLPFKPRRRTRAMQARERGLQPLADMMLAQQIETGSLEQHAQSFLTDEVPSIADACAGARDIVAEAAAEHAELRGELRRWMWVKGTLSSTVAEDAADAQGTYAAYHSFAEPLASIPPHRWLAMNRGEREKVLRLGIEVPESEAQRTMERYFLHNPRCVFVGDVQQALADSWRRLLAPSLEREVRSLLMERAQAHAVRVFGTNLRHLLLQPPLRGQRVMGIDPGYRTGCKLAVVDETGKVLATSTVYPHPPQNQRAEALEQLNRLIEASGVTVVAIGNGTASRETEQLVSELVRGGTKVRFTLVSEAGASVYSASPLARQELPDLDVSLRGAVSIARRLQDPLAELVKIDPQSIGVGLYQHDVDGKALGTALDQVVESAVNHVGVDVNTASPALLERISGLNARVAEIMVQHREEHGPFGSRSELMAVPGVGPRTFEQAAGFLRIPNADNPLDRTGIHPESYPAVQDLFALMEANGDEPDLGSKLESLVAEHGLDNLATVLSVGVPTLRDIIEQLTRAGRDPRDDLPGPLLRQDVLSIDDLREGMVLTGTVRNVVDFGAFVDIGVKQDGLVHVSEMGERYVRDPFAVLSVGDVIRVRVIRVERERGRIGLSMKGLAD